MIRRRVEGGGGEQEGRKKEMGNEVGVGVGRGHLWQALHGDGEDAV